MKYVDIRETLESLKKVVENIGDIARMAETDTERHVAYEDWGIDVGWLSTMYVTDNPEASYETAIKHKDYNERGDVNIFVLENYNHFAKALEGHNKWKLLFETEPLPEFIEDQASGLYGLMKAIKGRKIYRRSK